MSLKSWLHAVTTSTFRRDRAARRSIHRRSARRRVVASSEGMETRIMLSAVHWISDSNGFWDDPANWQDQSTLANRVPGGGDEVVINRPGSSVTVTIRPGSGGQGAGLFTLAADESLRIEGEDFSVFQPSTLAGNVLVSGGRIDGRQRVTLNGQNHWSGGSFAGQITIGAAGVLDISGAADKAISAQFENFGTVIHSGSGDVVDTANGSGSLWVNQPGSVYDFTGDDGRQLTSTFNNLGTVRKSAGSGESSFTENFHNLGGTVEATQGKLKLSRGSSTGGTYNASAGAVLDMTGGSTAFFTGTLTGSGSGRVELSSGSMHTGSTEATLNFPAGLFHWTSGAFTTSGRAWKNSRTVQISGASDRTISAQFENFGTVIHSGSGDVIDTSNGSGSLWVNQPGSVYEFTGDDGRQLTSTFNNHGTVRKSAGSGESSFTENFHNLGGTVEATQGKLKLSRGSSTGGTYNASAGAVLDMTGGSTAFFTGTLTGSGAGRVELSSGSMHTGSTEATLNFPAGLFHWTSGAFTTSGRAWKNSGTVQISGASDRTISAQFENFGTVIHSGSGDVIDTANGSGSLWVNQAGSVYDFTGDDGRQLTSTFNNFGTVRKSAGSGDSSFNAVFNNSGGVLESLSGRLLLAGTGGLWTDATLLATGEGRVVLASHLFVTGLISGSGTGRVELADGSLTSVSDGGSRLLAKLNFPQDYFHWTGGTIRGNGLTNIGTITISPLVSGPALEGPMLNEGLIQNIGPGSFSLNGQLLHNRVGGVYEVHGNITTYGRNQFGGRGTFQNDGTIRRVSGAGTAIIDASLAGSGGRVENETGTLAFNSGGSSSGMIFEAAAGTEIEFNGGFSESLFWSGRHSGSGAGRVNLNVALQGDNAVGGNLDFPDGMLQIVGGGIFGFIVNTGAVQLNSTDGIFARAVFENNGKWVLAGAGDFVLNANSQFRNRGLLEFRTDADMVVPGDASIGSMYLFNSGTLRKSGGSGSSALRHDGSSKELAFDNTGIVEVQTGTLSLNDRVLQFDGTTLTGGMWKVGPLATLTVPSATSITTNQGHIILDGPGSNFTNLTNLASNSGSFTLEGGRDFTSTGNLTNSGQIRVGPGSVLTVTGNLTETAASSLVGLWRADGNAQDSSGAGRHGTLKGTIPVVPGRYSDSFEFNGQHNYVSLGNPTALWLQNFTISAWVRREESGSGSILSYGLYGYGFGFAPNGRLFLSQIAIGHVESPSLGVNDSEWHHVAVTKSGGTVTFYVDGQKEEVFGYFPSYSFFTNVAIGGIESDGSTNSSFAGRIDEVAVYNRVLTAAELARVAGNADVPNSGRTVPSVDVVISNRPATGEYGRVVVNGQASLTGPLNIVRADGFGPVQGDSYDVVSFAGRTGNFSSINGLSPFFTATTSATGILIGTDHSAGDLATVSAKALGAGPAVSGQSIQIEYTVRNDGSNALSADWQDTVFLSTDRVLSADDTLLARVGHTGGLIAGASYTQTVTANVPGLVDDDYYVIVVANADKAVPEADRGDNIIDSDEAIRVQLPTLAFGQVLNGTILPGQPMHFRLTVPAGSRDVAIAFDAADGSAGAIELYAGRSVLPQASQFEFASGELNSTDASLLMSDVTPGEYLLTVSPRRLTGPLSFSLIADTPQATLSSVVPAKAGKGTVTFQIRGSNLLESDVVELVNSAGTRIAARSTARDDASHLFATFDLTSAAQGAYDVVVTRSGNSRVLSSAVTVEALKTSTLSSRLELPNRFRVGLTFNGAVVYENPGNVDMPAPLIVLSTDGQAHLRLSRSDEFQPNNLVLVAASQTGPAGILRPGEVWRIPFQVFSPFVSEMQVSIDYQTADASDAVDWDAMEASIRPSGVADADWDKFWLPFVHEAGSSIGGYVQVMARYATEVQARGGRFVSGADVLEVAMRDLYERSHVTAKGQVFLDDASHPLSGAEVLASRTSGTLAERIAVAVRTDSEGRFRLPELSPGTYAITVPGYQQFSATTVTVTGSGTAPDVTLTVRRGGVIRGVVRSSSNEVRLSGVLVRAENSSGEFRQIRTDSQGRFEVTGLVDDLWMVTAGSGQWAVSARRGLEIDSPTRVRDVIIDLSPAARLSGIVRTSSAAAANVRVEVRRQDGQLAVDPVTTNLSGQYFFDTLEPGSYVVVASLPGFAPVEKAITVVPGSTVAQDLILESGANLNVTIVDTNSGRLGDSTLEVRRAGIAVALLGADTNGQISLSDLAPGEYELTARSPGLLPAKSTMTLAAGTNSTTLTLSQAGRISGIVRDGNAVPIPNIQVQLSGINTSGDALGHLVSTAADGSYVFEGLPHGAYAITTGNGEGILRQDTAIDSGSLSRTMDFTVAGATITGTFVGADGVTPLADSTVLLLQNGTVLATAETNASGRYVFRSLLAGNYSLQGGGSSGISARQAITVAANSQTNAPVLQAGSRTLSGTIRFGGSPVAGASVLIVPTGSAVLGKYLIAVTGVDGTWSFSGLSPQDYQLLIESPGRVIISETVVVSADTVRDFVLQDGLQVTGTVSFAGLGVGDATVLFVDPVTHRVFGADTTDAAGNYTVEDLQSGPFTVLVHHAGNATLIASGVTVAVGTLVHNFSIAPESTQVSGTLLDDRGAPVANAIVEFIDASGQDVVSVYSGFDGTYSTTALPPGMWTAIARLPGYFTASVTGLVVASGTPVVRNFTLATAGTDDSAFVDGADDYAVAEATAEYLKERNPRPERHSFDRFPELPPPGPNACSEKEEAYIQALFAGDNKDAAFDAWKSAHENYNSTITNSALIFGFQFANLMGSIASVVYGEAMAGELAAASGARQATVIVAQLGVMSVQLKKVYKAGKEAIHSGNGKDILNFAKNSLKLLDEGGEVSHLINAIRGVEGGVHLPFHLRFGFVVALVNLYDLVKETSASAEALENLGETVPDARDRYYSALQEYIDRRAHYSRISCTPDDPPEPLPRKPGPRIFLANRQSGDPNEKEASSISGSSFVRAGDVIDYTIHFENMATATAPAQQVVITDVLDPALDLATLELGSLGFNGITVEVPGGRQEFETTTFVATDSNPVRVTVSLDTATRTLTWTMTSLDPETQELTEDPDAGFLPPNDAFNRGQGFVTFRVRSVASSPTGTVIPNTARIVFDVNAPIDTPLISTTIDAQAPVGTMAALPSTTPGAQIVLNWSGNDAGGSGAQTYDVYYSVDNGPWQALVTGTQETTTTLIGVVGSTYRFFCLATDVVGLKEPRVDIAETTTQLVNAGVPVLNALPAQTQNQTPAVSWNAVPGATAYDLWLSNLTTRQSPLVRTTVTGTSFTPSANLGIGQFRVWVRSIDAAGNASAWSLPGTFRVNTRVALQAIERYQPTPRPTIAWNPMPGAARYDLWINNMTTGQVQVVRQTNLTSTSWTADSDFPIGRYRVWVRALDSAGVPAEWSTALDFVSLPRPAVTSPSGGTFDRTPEFAWSPVLGAVRYQVNVVNRNTGAMVISQSVASTSFSPSTPMPDGPYHWWVYGVSNQGLSTLASATTLFYVGGITTLTAPSGNTTDTTPTFSWQPVHGAVRYYLWVDKVGSTSQQIRESQLTVTEFTPTTPLSSGSYRAWIRAISQTGESSPWSVVKEFSIVDASTSEGGPWQPATESLLVIRDLNLLPDIDEAVRSTGSNRLLPTAAVHAADRHVPARLTAPDADYWSADRQQSLVAICEVESKLDGQTGQQVSIETLDELMSRPDVLFL
ncbi:MAG: carboxypeptidase regulatory-like domain-containing protein [Planctomycetaceae bacterium]|nr:carboxypeptidase regulatory-like domain-containing protein [Planctomycetaceae bacterium]